VVRPDVVPYSNCTVPETPPVLYVPFNDALMPVTLLAVVVVAAGVEVVKFRIEPYVVPPTVSVTILK